MIHYAYYNNQGSVTHADLCAANAASRDLLARAENNGCEGFYTEVARWSYVNNRWERLCFVKFLGGEDGNPDLTAQQLAERYAKEVNDAAGPGQNFLTLIHNLPSAPKLEPVT